MKFSLEKLDKNKNSDVKDENREKDERTSFLWRLRKNVKFKYLMLALGFQAALVEGAIKPAAKHYGLDERQKTILSEIESLGHYDASDKEKVEKLKEWFGPYGLRGVKGNVEMESGEEMELDGEVGAVSMDSIKMDQGRSMGPEEIEGSLMRAFPESWFKDEVESIIYNEERPDLPEKYGQEVKMAGKFSGGRGAQRGELSIFGIRSVNDNRDIIAHELGHANDWFHDREMDAEERVDLLYDIGRRLQEEDRMKFDYIEDIENDDEKLEFYLKAKEYWAEICETYFSTPWTMSRKDYNLVDRQVQKHDPGFDPLVGHLPNQ